MKTIEPVPLTPAQFKLAKALRWVRKEHGSLGAFFKHLEKQRKAENRRLCEEQQRELDAI